MTEDQCIKIATDLWGWKSEVADVDDGKKTTENVIMYFATDTKIDGPFIKGCHFFEDKSVSYFSTWPSVNRTIDSMQGHRAREEFITEFTKAITLYLNGVIGQYAFFDLIHESALNVAKEPE